MPAVEPTTHRQKRLYEDTCDIWAVDALTYADDIEPDEGDYTRIAEGQKFYLFTKSEVAAPAVPGRFPQDNIFTFDEAHFPHGVTVEQDYILKVTTANSPLVGTFWRVMGDAQVRTARTRRKPNLKAVYVKRERSAPPGVS
jgi:hypothetical protein